MAYPLVNLIRRSAPKLRLALLHERLNALDVVLSLLEDALAEPLEVSTRLGIRGQASVEHEFGEAERERPPGGELPGKLHHAGHELLCRDHLLDEAQFERALRRYHLARHNESLCLCEAYEPH